MQRYFLIATFLLAPFFNHAQNFSLASDAWPPFTNVEDEIHYAQDIVVEALKRNNYKALVEIIEFGDVMDGIKNGKFAGSAALWKSSEREEQLLFSKPYLENRLVLVGKKGSQVNFTRLADLRGKKLAVVANYAYGPELFELSTITTVKTESDQECLNMLLAGKVDYILLDHLFAHHLKEYQGSDVARFLAIGDHSLLNKPLHFALRKDLPKAKEIIALFNSTIDKMIADGTYNELLNVSWILADIDNDGQPEVILGGDRAGLNPPDNVYRVIIGTEPGDAPATTTGEYYIGGNKYSNWQDIPEQFKMKPYNNSNNINILTLDLNKK